MSALRPISSPVTRPAHCAPVRCGVHPNGDAKAGHVPLYIAAECGRSGAFRRLLVAGADPDSKNFVGDGALHWAVEYGKAGVVHLLLAAGADVNSINWLGNTPLHMAVIYGQAEVLGLLLAAGADVNSINNWAETPLHVAVGYGVNEKAPVLLGGGDRLGARGREGYTARLLAAGGDVHCRDFLGSSVIDTARQVGNTRAFVLLQEAAFGDPPTPD